MEASAPVAQNITPKRAGLVLAALILVAAVANLNLSVANVALPYIGKALDASQTGLNLIAVGYSLGLAASVLYLGAIGDRYGRKLLLVLGTAIAIPASIVAAVSGSVEVLFLARVIGGLAAGMAFPTTLSLITAALGRRATHEGDRALVRGRRSLRRARAARSRSDAREVRVGLGLPDHACRWP